MTYTHYADVLPDGRVRACFEWGGPPFALDQAEGEPVLLEAPIDWRGPTPTSVLHCIEGAVVWVETASLAEIKAAKSAEITRERIATDSDHFTYQGQGGQSLSIRTADKDMFDLLIADARISKGGMPPNWPGGWKAIENSYVPISTVEQWNAFFIAMYDAGIDNFNHSQQLKARISAATTPEQVAAIHWGMDLSLQGEV